MCSPDCMGAPHGQDGSSALPILWSHCRCGPLPVLNQAYAARARRFHMTFPPRPYVSTARSLTLISFATLLIGRNSSSPSPTKGQNVVPGDRHRVRLMHLATVLNGSKPGWNWLRRHPKFWASNTIFAILSATTALVHFLQYTPQS